MEKTYLYIKEHSETGLKYFGKTTKNNVGKYNGSGVYWKKHIKKHGKEYVKTIWVSEPFYDQGDLIEFAIFFSEFFDIVNSKRWSNLIVENGLDGAPKGVFVAGLLGKDNPMYGKIGKLNPFHGRKHTPEQKEKWSKNHLGERNPNFGAKSFTEETYKKLRRPKLNKENYKGTVGKITCINKLGIAIQIPKEEYNNQKQFSLDASDWEFVNTNSNEAKKRKQINN
jgi:hypothetical protein